jgi:hypothetical protein
MSFSQFQPIFVHDSQSLVNPETVVRAQELGFLVMDIRQAGTTIHGRNPAVILYSEGREMLDRIPHGDKRFLEGKHTGYGIMMRPGRMYVNNLPEPRKFAEWFFGKPVAKAV